jgi:hypothetical protein
MEAGRETRPPRGALAAIAVGLLATVAAALLSTEGPTGSAALGWEAMAPLPASSAALPGGGEMRLAEAGIRDTEATSSEYRLYRAAAVLTIEPGAVSPRLVRCATRVPARTTTIAHTPESRAAYPLPSTALEDQPLPRSVTIEFGSNGAELAKIELADAFDAFTNRPGATVEWEPYRANRQGWEWRLPRLRVGKSLRLGFAAIWRTTGTPTARISCTSPGASSSTVRTSGTLERARGTD